MLLSLLALTVPIFFYYQLCNLNRSLTQSHGCNFISNPLVANFDIIVYGLNGFMDSSLRIVHTQNDDDGR